MHSLSHQMKYLTYARIRSAAQMQVNLSHAVLLVVPNAALEVLEPLTMPCRASPCHANTEHARYAQVDMPPPFILEGQGPNSLEQESLQHKYSAPICSCEFFPPPPTQRKSRLPVVPSPTRYAALPGNPSRL